MWPKTRTWPSPSPMSSMVPGYNAGQSCCAVERAYVHRSCYDVFIERAEAAMSEYRLGDPLDENTTMGSLASSAALDLLDRQVADAVARGARLILGGKRMAATDGNFYLPTLLVDVSNDAEVMQAESFGPILPVLAVGSDQEAVERMNDSRFGLTASVWTGSQEKAAWFARRLRVGTIYQNRCDYLDPALPWKGFTLEWFTGDGPERVGIFHDRMNLDSIWVSLRVAFFVTLLSVGVGTCAAFLFEQEDFRFKPLLYFLTIAPLAMVKLYFGKKEA